MSVEVGLSLLLYNRPKCSNEIATTLGNAIASRG